MEEIRLKKRRRRIIGFSILGAVIVAIIAIIVACSLSGNKEEVKEGEFNSALNELKSLDAVQSIASVIRVY